MRSVGKTQSAKRYGNIEVGGHFMNISVVHFGTASMIGTSSVFGLTSDSSDAGTLKLPLIQMPVQGSFMQMA